MASILIATDDSALYEILAAEIGAEGHEAHWAIDGHEACEMVPGTDPSLIMLDAGLAIYNAFETCALLRSDPEVPAQLPILILSDDDVDPHKLEKVRATALFPKTHPAHDLRDALVKYLGSEAGA